MNALRSRLRSGVRVGLAATVLSAVAVSLPVSSASAATASNDSLPTVQVDGVVWDQVVVGNRVYVAGRFNNARPAGAAPGTNQTPRANLLAYDITTGGLISSWAPVLNEQAVTIAASPDGSKIYVGGDFTSVNGISRYRLAAIDAKTGATVQSFQANANARVRALAVDGNTLYVGGTLTSLKGSPRFRAGALTLAGELLPWAPQANMPVTALTVAPRPGANRQVVLGGWFSTMNGAVNYGTASVDAVTGASLPWPMNRVVRNGGLATIGISDLTNDGQQVYGSGFNFKAYAPGNLEGTFAADLSGNAQWVAGCRGDHHSVFTTANVLYQVGHAHDCSFIGYFSQLPLKNANRALSFTTTADPGRFNTTGDFIGQRAPAMLGWQPSVSQGTITGQDQGAWSVTGDSRYVVIGGEFPSVNGRGQAGLARFAIGSQATPTNVAADDFNRTVTSGWGVADVGGSWISTTTSGSVVNNTGLISLTPGSSFTSRLASVNVASTDSTVTFWPTTKPTGTFYVSLIGRRNSAGDYRAEVRLPASGDVGIALNRVASGTTTPLSSRVTATGVSVDPARPMKLRLQVTGTNPTTLRAKVWYANSAEPANWQVTGTDATFGLQTTGTVGVSALLPSTTQALKVAVDDLTVATP